MQFNIFTRLISGFLLIAILVAVIGLISLREIYKITIPLNVEIPQSLEVLQETSHLDGLAQFIRYYDEVLTQSARNYVFTQDKKWEKRYRNVEPKLNAVIKEAIERGDRKDRTFFSDIDKANIALVEMEYVSIDLINQRKVNEAVQVLESDTYWIQKEKYEQALRDYVLRRGVEYDKALEASTDILQALTEDTRRIAKVSTQIIVVSIVLVLILAVSFGLFISHTIARSIRKARDAAVAITLGNTDIEIDISGTDEIAELLQAVDKMRRSLKVVMKKGKENST